MDLPRGFKSYIAISNIDDILKNLNQEEMSSNYAQFFHLDFDMSDEDYLKIGEKIGGSFLQYGNNNFMDFNDIFMENELHYDGISANNKYSVPDYLMFKVYVPHTQSGGEFRLLNTASALNDLSPDLLRFLQNHKLEFYGFPSFFNPTPSKNELTFAIDCIQTYQKINTLRMHIPSEDPEMVKVRDNLIYCDIDGFGIKFSGLSGIQTKNIFDEIRSQIFNKDNLLEFNFTSRLLVIANNHFTFHGRNRTSLPDKRLMRRYQLVTG